MKSELLLSAMGEISPTLVAELLEEESALSVSPVPRRAFWRRWGALAACLAVAVTGIYTIRMGMPAFSSGSSHTAQDATEAGEIYSEEPAGGSPENGSSITSDMSVAPAQPEAEGPGQLLYLPLADGGYATVDWAGGSQEELISAWLAAADAQGSTLDSVEKTTVEAQTSTSTDFSGSGVVTYTPESTCLTVNLTGTPLTQEQWKGLINSLIADADGPTTVRPLQNGAAVSLDGRCPENGFDFFSLTVVPQEGTP